MGEDLSKKHEQGGWAVFLPAISSYYVKQLSKMDEDPDAYGVGRWPAALPHGPQGLDFLKKDDSYFHYKWGLYSAGHALMDMEKSKVKEAMVQKRDPDTLILGDSGGFQIATGVIKVDWDDLEGEKWQKIRSNILNWLEETSDWAMTLDVPATAADPGLSERSGFTHFDQTLEITMDNLDYFMRNRTPGKTKFLNVISASTLENSKEWYESVKHFSDPAFVKEAYGDADRTLEGYAFAGINMKNMTAAMSRLVDLIDDGLIEGRDWIHFLGTSRLNWACYLTSIQRELRKHHNPNITLSFDCASPFLANAKGLTYSYNEYAPEKMSYIMKKAFDDFDYHDKDLQMPFGGPIMGELTIGDICIRGNEKCHPLYKEEKDPELNKDADPDKPNPQTTWDGVSYMLMMGHNVYNHITAVQEANKLMDLELVRNPVSHKDWVKEKKKSAASNLSPYVPSDVLYFESFIRNLLDPKYSADERREIIADSKTFLDSISFGGVKATTFGNLFGEAE